MDNEHYLWTIESYCKIFLQSSMIHFMDGRILDASGNPLEPGLCDENPYYKGFLLVTGENVINRYMHRMITRPETGPRKTISLKRGLADFLEFINSERPSDITYFIDNKKNIMVPVKGQLKNNYEKLPAYKDRICIDTLLQGQALPWNYLDSEGNVAPLEIGGRTEAAIINSAKFPEISIISANQRAFGFGMGKVSLFKSGSLVSDFKFELSTEHPQIYESVIGILTYYVYSEKPRKALLPDKQRLVYFDAENQLKLTDETNVNNKRRKYNRKS